MNTDNPLVSIITPCMNGREYIEHAINNVLEQRFHSLEHIVVDGGSTDGTVDILRNYPHLRWISEPDNGQAHAINKGFRMARGEIIGWLNGDDSYTLGAIHYAAEYMLKNPECDIVYSDCNIIRDDGRILTVFRTRQVVGWEQLIGGWIHTPAVFFRRRILDKVGYLNENLHYVLDNEFWLRAAPYVRQHYLPRTLANFHHRSNSKSVSNYVNFSPEMCKIYEETFNREPYISQIPCEIRQKILARYFWTCGVNFLRFDRSSDAANYLLQAFERFGIMKYPEIVTECLITRYVERDVLPWQEVERLLGLLPFDACTKRTMTDWCRNEYHKLRFYAAFNRSDWSEVRRAGFRVIFRDPSMLRSRGFLSVWSEGFLGSKIMGLVRRLI